MPKPSKNGTPVAGLTHAEFQQTIDELGLAQACIRRAYERLRQGLGASEWLDALDNSLNDIANATDYALAEHASSMLDKCVHLGGLAPKLRQLPNRLVA